MKERKTDGDRERDKRQTDMQRLKERDRWRERICILSVSGG